MSLTQKRFTITLEMPPLRLVAEVISPGKTNRERDLIRKRAQYAACGIPEYWLISPDDRTVTVLELDNAGRYAEVGVFGGSDGIISPTFRSLTLTAEQLFLAEF
ncbi:Uma2 family endonuclease [Phormidesmis priestleyi]